jgi:HEAT repeat protein
MFLALVLLAPAGCAEGPVPYVLSLNPWRRQEWRQDEQYRPTLHRQLAEIEVLQDNAASMSLEQQVHWANEMTYLVRTQSNPVLRGAAVDTLAVLAVPEAEAGLRAALADKDPSVRIAACDAWASHGGAAAVEQLAERLGSDTDLDVRLAATRALGRFSEPAAHRALALALDDSDPAIRHRAIQSLKQSSGRDFGDNIDAWKQFAQGKDPGPDAPPWLVQRIRQWF